MAEGFVVHAEADNSSSSGTIGSNGIGRLTLVDVRACLKVAPAVLADALRVSVDQPVQLDTKAFEPANGKPGGGSLSTAAAMGTTVTVSGGEPLRVSAARVGLGFDASLRGGGEFEVKLGTPLRLFGVQYELLGAEPAPTTLVLHLTNGTRRTLDDIAVPVLNFPDPTPVVVRLTFRGGDAGVQFISLAAPCNKAMVMLGCLPCNDGDSSGEAMTRSRLVDCTDEVTTAPCTCPGARTTTAAATTAASTTSTTVPPNVGSTASTTASEESSESEEEASDAIVSEPEAGGGLGAGGIAAIVIVVILLLIAAVAFALWKRKQGQPAQEGEPASNSRDAAVAAEQGASGERAARNKGSSGAQAPQPSSAKSSELLVLSGPTKSKKKSATAAKGYDTVPEEDDSESSSSSSSGPAAPVAHSYGDNAVNVDGGYGPSVVSSDRHKKKKKNRNEDVGYGPSPASSKRHKSKSKRGNERRFTDVEAAEAGYDAAPKSEPSADGSSDQGYGVGPASKDELEYDVAPADHSYGPISLKTRAVGAKSPSARNESDCARSLQFSVFAPFVEMR